VRVLNPEVIAALRITQQALDAVTAHEEQELRRRERLFRGERPPFDVAGRTIILVDDGMATGSTARAAIAALRGQQPASIVVAVPVAPPSTCQMLAHEADHLECLLSPEPFLAVGQWYQDFSETTDADVRSLLDAAARRPRDVLGGRMGADGDELEWS
jgi:putative phosphoribosyl transferase